MNNATVTILDRDKLTVSVQIPEDAAPLVLNSDTGVEERDYGNADWPTDEEIDQEVSRQLGRPARMWFFDKGDSLLEGIYLERKT